MKYLLNTIETYRVGGVEEALAMRDEMSNETTYALESFSYTEKYDKKNDENYVLVKVKKTVNSEKMPTSGVKVSYDY